MWRAGDPAFVWGMNFKVRDAAECCEACKAHARVIGDTYPGNAAPQKLEGVSFGSLLFLERGDVEVTCYTANLSCATRGCTAESRNASALISTTTHGESVG
eukprot:6731496-Pyramimonas_sp.AAC.2